MPCPSSSFEASSLPTIMQMVARQSAHEALSAIMVTLNSFDLYSEKIVQKLDSGAFESEL